MRKVINFCIKNALVCILFFTLLTILLGWKATTVKIDSDITNILPKSEKDKMDDLDSFMFLGFRANPNDELYTIKNLELLTEAITQIETLPEIKKTISIFNTQTLLMGENNRIISETLLPNGQSPMNDKELEIFKARVIDNPFFDKLLISDDNSYIITAFLTKKVSDDIGLFNSELSRMVEPLREAVDLSVAGELVVMNRAEFYLTKDFSTLLVAALIVMLAILFISFRARRALLLPVIVVIAGVIWTVGFMSIFGFKLSVVTCVVPALVLTIGSSYTIHVLNEFFRNSHTAIPGDKNWIIEAVNHVNKTILMASLTTIIGFMSLFSGSQSVLKEFALSVSFGVASTAILSLFLLPAIFSLIKDPSQLHAEAVKGGFISVILEKFGPVVFKFKYLFIIIGLTIVMTLFYVIPRLTVGSDYYSYFPEGDEVMDEVLYLTKMSGGSSWVNLTLEAPPGTKKFFSTYEGLKIQSKIEAEIASNSGVYDVVSMVSYLKKINKLRFGNYDLPESKGLIEFLIRSFTKYFNTQDGLFKEVNLVEDDYNKVTFIIRIYDKTKNMPIAENDFPAFMDSLDGVLNYAKDNNIKTNIWGEDYVVSIISSILLKDQLLTIIVSFFLVFLVTCLYFKSIYYGIVAIIPLITAVCFNYLFMKILNIPLDVTTIMVSSVAIGVGVDDAIHFLIQFIHQSKKNPMDINKVIQQTYFITGKPIVLTTVSIVSGMIILVLASFLPVGYFGLLVTISLIGALIGTLVFMPAVLIVVYQIKNRLNSLRLRGKN